MSLLACDRSQTVQPSSDVSEQNPSQTEKTTIQVFVPLHDGRFDETVDFEFSSSELPLEEKVSEVLAYLAIDQGPGYLQLYGKEYSCTLAFLAQNIAYLECMGLDSGQMGFYQEQIALLSLIKTLFQISDIQGITIFKNQESAKVFAQDLILPKVIDRDFMKGLENLVSKRTDTP